MEGRYQNCSVCGKLADDGGLNNHKFTCHDCLDRHSEKSRKISCPEEVILKSSYDKSVQASKEIKKENN